MAWQSAPKPCKICGVVGHTALNCYQRRRRAIVRGQTVIKRNTTALRKQGKITVKWLKFRNEWFENHPPDETGYYHCHYCIELDMTSMLTRKEATLDHWLSRSRRPDLRFDESNIVVACWWHNRDKSSLSGDEYIEILHARHDGTPPPSRPKKLKPID